MQAAAVTSPSIEPVAPTSMDTPGQYVTFTCAGRSLAIDIMSVREIRGWTPTTQMPGQNGSDGILDIRGAVVRIFDLARMIGGDWSDKTPDSKVVIVVSISGEDVGLIVDTVSDIVFAGVDDMRQVPKAERNTAVRGLIKVEEQLVSILDPDALLDPRSF
ncbi:chemotaxis protein CheW [Devosia chinhatensis]|nr:chemotaxis protein CheW [Devosia chinhatensis]